MRVECGAQICVLQDGDGRVFIICTCSLIFQFSLFFLDPRLTSPSFLLPQFNCPSRLFLHSAAQSRSKFPCWPRLHQRMHPCYLTPSGSRAHELTNSCTPDASTHNPGFCVRSQSVCHLRETLPVIQRDQNTEGFCSICTSAQILPNVCAAVSNARHF